MDCFEFIKKFSGLRSRWAIFWECKYFNISTICLKIILASYSLKLPCYYKR